MRPRTVTIDGYKIIPTTNPDHSDAGGAKTVLNGTEYRMTASGAFFTREITRKSHPWKNGDDFLMSTTRAIRALETYQLVER